MKFEEFCDICCLEVVVKRQPRQEDLWIAKFTGNEVFVGAGYSPDRAINELSKAVSGRSFKNFPQAIEQAVVPKFEYPEYED